MIKEAFTEKNLEPKLSPQEYKEIGQQFLKIDKKLAQTFFKKAGLNEEEIQKIINSGETSKNSEKESEILPKNEKNELYKKMAEEFEKKFKKTGESEYWELAKTYQREVENLEAENLKKENKKEEK